MTESPFQRRLVAILAADVVEYSRLVGLDEEGTVSQLNEHRQKLIDVTIGQHQGRIVKTTGDGLLAEFASIVDALRSAVEWQRGMLERNAKLPPDRQIRYRIGITVGDVIIQDHDIFGDGVNIAARLESLAEPGGICVSEDAYRQVRGKIDVAFEDSGEQRLKNIAAPIRVYRVQIDRQPSPPPTPLLSLPDKPSIAVLAFENLSGDPEQEYFADGIVEEIITALSRLPWLFVIARNSSFTYKGRTVDVKQIGRELGVRYVLEGSVRRAKSRVRISGQLIDASSAAHLWADRFEGSIEDIFDLQDQITASVVGAIAPKLEQAEIDRSRRKPTESLDAYDYFLRGMAVYHLWTLDTNREALSMFTRATELDPNYAAAYAMAARCYAQVKAGGWPSDRVLAISETRRLATKAVLHGDDALTLSTAGFALAWVVGEVEYGDTLIEQGLKLNPNVAWAWLYSGWAKVWLGQPDLAISRLERAMRLSPQDPHILSMRTAMSCAYLFCNRYAEAWQWAEVVVRRLPNYGFPLCVATASAALAGKSSEATAMMTHLRQLMPWLRISNLLELFPIRRPEDFNTFAQGLRQAGLPE